VSLDRDEKVDSSDARAVHLGGREFTVLPLTLRQIIAIADFVPKLSGLTAENLSSERLQPLAEVLWHGLRRAHPQMTRDEFFDLPITVAEMVRALPVVVEQAGGKKADTAAGEVQATSVSTQPTGESSSPNSA